MDFLKNVLGKDLFAQVKTMIDAHNGDEANANNLIKLANLSSGDYVAKGKYDSLESNLTSKNDELAKANELIAEMKKQSVGNDELLGKINSYETQVADLQKQLQDAQKDNAIKLALLEANAVDVDYLIYKLKEKNDDLRIDENGKLVDFESKLKGLKTQFPNQFGKSSQRKVDERKLPTDESDNDSSTITQEQFNKMGYKSRVRLRAENPELYNKLTNKEE